MATVMLRLSALFWPSGEPELKFRVIGAVTLIFIGKLTAIITPFVYKLVVDSLSIHVLVSVPLVLVFSYGLAYIGAQVTDHLRQLVFVKVGQRAIRITAVEVFEHLHKLSLRFHFERKTGGLSRVVERGTSGIEYLLELIFFNVIPNLIELAVVSVLLWNLYSAEIAAVTFFAILGYISLTFLATRRQVQLRREMNRLDVSASVKAVDSFLNYETVKYFNNEAHELSRFTDARLDYEAATIRYQSGLVLLNIGKVIIVAAGAVMVMISASKDVIRGQITIGDFVLVNSYLLQLYAPLGVLGAVYGNVKQSLTDVEAMLGLLSLPADICDQPAAPALVASRGHVIFDGVSFGYDPRRPILKEVSFEIRPGQTVAVVGPSGGGKSTLVRLLFRFYDVDRGTIKIDEQNIRDVTQLSLRQAIGLVPQDTVMFNETIYYNIAYGRVTASREEVEQAARLAHIHDLICSLPDGYDSSVGERGLKLSGGERQRVAIARVFLKRPAFLIFDEATSALDSNIEEEIQASLRLVSSKRSTLVIAHRLSTIVNSDEILVLDAGRIVERGSHEELLAVDGIYAGMWSRQQRAATSEVQDL